MAHALRQTTTANIGQAAHNIAPKTESLASVAPRVISLSEQVRTYTARVENSFGISREENSDAADDEASTLMGQLLSMEINLRSAAYALENILAHING